MTGADWLLEALAAEGIDHLFGNPGSTELPLIEAAGRQDAVDYVLCLHEASALGMADGYAQATGRLAAVNVHVQPGAANAMSGILNARRARVPLLVTVGQQVSELLPSGPFLGGEILELVAPLVKDAWEPSTADELARDIRAAVCCALTPPHGPVALSIPLDVQAGTAPPPHRPEAPPSAPEPDAQALDRAADLLRSARHPVLLIGDEIVRAKASVEVLELAARLGAPVYGEPMGGRAPLPTDARSWRGPLPPFGAEIRPILEPYDVLLAIGMPVFRLFGTSPGGPIGPQQQLIHLDVDGDEIGRSQPTAVRMLGDPLAGLRGLLARLHQEPRAAPVAPARAAISASGPEIDQAGFASAIASAVAQDDIVVDEALTAGRQLRQTLSPRRPDTWFAHRGSALGWGLPAGIGVAMAEPDRRVMVVHGDGSLLFGIHALWTAANRRQGIAIVVGDNRGYEILRAGMEGVTGRPEGTWPGLALDDPPVDLAGLCASFGADVATAHDLDELERELDRIWERATNRPAVVIARVSGRTAPVGYPL